MPEFRALDKATGLETIVDETTFDPARHDVVSGQVLTVDPLAGVSGVETAVGQALDVEALRRGFLEEEVAPERRAAITEKQVTEQVFGGGANAAEQLARGVGSGLTFGLSELVLSESDPFERERQRRKRQAGGAAFEAGSLIGSVAPALLSGGTGLLGSAARLTPAGRLAAATGQVAGRGGLRGAVSGGILEGVAQAGGDYLARESLDVDPAFSGEALASSLLSGGALGALGGVAGHGLERALVAGARRLSAKADDVLATPTERLATSIGVKRPATFTRYKGVVRRRLTNTDAAHARKIGEALETAATRPAARELDDLLLSPQLAAARQIDDASLTALETGARTAARDFDEAATAARSWFQRFSAAADLPAAKSKITAKLDDSLMDEGAGLIARLDEARAAMDDHLDEVAQRAGVQRAPAGAPPEALAASSQTLRERVTTGVERLRRPVEAVLGAGELARDVGIETPLPTARDIPIIGPVMGAYLRFRGAQAAARGLAGRIPHTAATRASARVIQAERQVRAKVLRTVAGGVQRVARSAVPRITSKKAAAQIREVLDADLVAESAAVEQDLATTTSPVQRAAASATVAALAYLQETAPRDPMPFRPPGLPPWEPTALQTRAWERRLAAVLDPAAALDAVMRSPSSVLELDVLRRVHPAHWLEAQAVFRDNLAKLRASMPAGQLRALGRAFGVPVSASQMLGYPPASTGAVAGAPPPVAPRPPSGPSRAAELEAVE